MLLMVQPQLAPSAAQKDRLVALWLLYAHRFAKEGKSREANKSANPRKREIRFSLVKQAKNR
jgi:hypothetical protein